MRTRRLHARLAYAVRVDDRASIAYAAAPARNVRRDVVSPEVLMRSLSSQCHASRIKKSSAFGARHEREDSSAGYAPRQHPAKIVENAKALVLGTRQRRQHSETIDRTRR
jgi:hypothetical protein